MILLIFSRYYDSNHAYNSAGQPASNYGGYGGSDHNSNYGGNDHNSGGYNSGYNSRLGNDGGGDHLDPMDTGSSGYTYNRDAYDDYNTGNTRRITHSRLPIEDFESDSNRISLFYTSIHVQ